MIQTLVKKTWIPIIIIGCLMVGVAFITGATNFENATIIHKEIRYIYGWQWNYYTIDLKLYVTNLENSLNVMTLPNILPNTPQLPLWPTLSNNIADYGNNILLVVKYIAKILITGINFIIYILNLLLLLPIKLLLYPARIIITLVGLNTTDEGFIDAINILGTLNIKYIPINF